MSDLNAYLFKVRINTLLGAKYCKHIWVFAKSPKQAKQFLHKNKTLLGIDAYGEPLDWFNGNCFTKTHAVGDLILGTNSNDEKL